MKDKLYLYKQICGYPNTKFEPFDCHVGIFLANHVQKFNDEAFLLGCYLAMQQRGGNIAIDVNHLIGKSFDQWTDISIDSSTLKSIPLFQTEFKQTQFESFKMDGILRNVESNEFKTGKGTIIEETPIVIFENWIYLQRYWRYESEIVDFFKRKMVYEPVINQDEIDKIIFNDNDEINWQQIAVKKALSYPVTIITGGPGTGKTYTILSILSVILKNRPSATIALCAPTGKAAARMMESISNSLLAMEDVIPSIPKDAVTIHRLIGWNPGTGKPRFHAGNRLPFDIVILDEASMVDLALLSRLVVALPDQGRLILLGDKDQLASVEAGSVFGEIASVVDTNQLNDDVIKSVDIKYEDIIVRLKKSRRFSADSGIGFLAAMVNKGDAESSWGWLKDQNLIRGGDYGDPSLWLKDIISKVSAVHDKLLIEIDILKEIISRDEDNISPIGSIINDLFRILGELQVLSAHRRGIYGSIYLNNRIDSILSEKSSFKKGNQNLQDEWYNGRPVIITSNNYDLGLFNGDIGIAMIIENQVKITFGYDEQAETITWYSPAQLANVETSWVLTVHKSQGSEFDNVDLIIPGETSPILTRELAYTALTRSRNKFELWGTENVWKEMINRKIERKSGLGKRILHD